MNEEQFKGGPQANKLRADLVSVREKLIKAKQGDASLKDQEDILGEAGIKPIAGGSQNKDAVQGTSHPADEITILCEAIKTLPEGSPQYKQISDWIKELAHRFAQGDMSLSDSRALGPNTPDKLTLLSSTVVSLAPNSPIRLKLEEWIRQLAKEIAASPQAQSRELPDLDKRLEGAEHNQLIFSAIQTDFPEEQAIYDTCGDLVLDLLEKYPLLAEAFNIKQLEVFNQIIGTQSRSIRIYYRQGDVLILSSSSRSLRTHLLVLTPQTVAVVPIEYMRNQGIDYIGKLAAFSGAIRAPVILEDGSIYIFTDQPLDYGDGTLGLNNTIRVNNAGNTMQIDVLIDTEEAPDFLEAIAEFERGIIDPDYPERKKQEKSQARIRRQLEIVDQCESARDAVWYLTREIIETKRRTRKLTLAEEVATIDPSNLAIQLLDYFNVKDIRAVPLQAYGRRFRLTGKTYGYGVTAIVYEAEDVASGQKVAVKFGYALIDHITDRMTHDTRMNAPRAVYKEDLFQETTVMQLAQRNKTTSEYAPNAAYQTTAYLATLGEGEFSNLNAPVPYLIMEALPRGKAVSANDLYQTIITLARSEHATVTQKVKIFKTLCYLHGYYLDACRRTYGYTPWDAQHQDLMLVPEEKRAYLLDLNVSKPEWRNTNWIAYMTRIIRDLIRFNPYYTEDLIESFGPLSSWDKVRVNLDEEQLRIIRHAIEYYGKPSLEALSEQHLSEGQLNAYEVEQFILLLQVSKADFYSSPEGMGRVVQQLADLSKY